MITAVCVSKWMPEGASIATGGLIYFDPTCPLQPQLRLVYPGQVQDG